jgi:Glycosyl transferase WecG/TagA/CpsF family
VSQNWLRIRWDAVLREDVNSRDIISGDGWRVACLGLRFRYGSPGSTSFYALRARDARRCPKESRARLFGIGVSQRVAGVDLMQRLLETCAAKGYHPYFLGATEKALSGALHNLRIRFPNLEIAGAQHGYYPRESEAEVVAAISCVRSRLPIHRYTYAA